MHCALCLRGWVARSAGPLFRKTVNEAVKIKIKGRRHAAHLDNKAADALSFDLVGKERTIAIIHSLNYICHL